MNDYIILPVNDGKPVEKLILCRDGQSVYEFAASPDFDTPTYPVYIDVRRFYPGTLELKRESGESLAVGYTDRLPDRSEVESGRELRPVIHFTAPVGWINDPNGLVFVDGVYHVFAQHNPMGRNWGNMTWLYATSDDLLHWQDKGDVLFPDAMGAMFSGSAIIDTENAAGFGKNAMLLFYTAAGTPVTQCLAYSTDGGATFTKYPKNPIIPHIIGGNRDPKVVWSEELGKWILALYLNEHSFRLFTSLNLTEWDAWETVDLDSDTECPNFYPLPFENGRIWVLSAAADKYKLFTITDGRLVQLQEELALCLSEGGSYAAQVFSGTQPRTLRLAWLYTESGNAVFNSQLGIPTDMFLKREGDRIRLGTYPALDVMRLKREPLSETVTDAGEVCLVTGDGSSGRAVSVELAFDRECSDFELSVFGCEITVNPGLNRFCVNGKVMPLDYADLRDKRLCLVVDTLSCECFADGGLVYGNILIQAQRQKGISLKTVGNCRVALTLDLLSPA